MESETAKQNELCSNAVMNIAGKSEEIPNLDEDKAKVSDTKNIQPRSDEQMQDTNVPDQKWVVNTTKAIHTQPTAEAYRPPKWAMVCPMHTAYRLEVIKNGTPLPECTVNLTCANTSTDTGTRELSFCLFGRQPELFYAPNDQLQGQCAVMAHPSVSRLHAVLQYGEPPPSIAKTSAVQTDVTGWYLQDLDSTHGTFVNKRRLPPGRFVRIHVGYVIRFGASTRLYLMCGPDQDTEQQSAQSWSELKQAYHARQLAQQSSKLIGSAPVKDVELGCDWGFSTDDPSADGTNFLSSVKGAACLSHENLYQDDPRRALKAYFEREGIEPAPEYEFVEAAFGKQNCRIELPLDSGTVTAEVPVSGKRKEATAACALEACRLLDRLGEFDPNKNAAGPSKMVRSKRYWEENDYYSSDEDTFTDRTGQVERKRLERIRQLGVEGQTAAEAAAQVASLEAGDKGRKKTDGRALSESSMLKVLAELEKIGGEIVTLEEQLREVDEKFAPQGENPSELDELEAYMNALKSGGPSRKERMKLKSRLFILRQTEMRLFQKAGLPQPRRRVVAAGGSIAPDDETGKMARTDAAAAVRAARRTLEMVNESTTEKTSDGIGYQLERSTNTRLKMDQIKRNLPGQKELHPTRTIPSNPDEPFLAEDDEEGDEENGTDQVINDQPEELQQVDSKPKSSSSSSSHIDAPGHVSSDHLKTCRTELALKDELPSVPARGMPLPQEQAFPKSVQCGSSPKACGPKIPAFVEPDFKDGSLLSSSDPNGTPISREATESGIPRKRSKPSPLSARRKTDVYTLPDPDYVTWIPPSDQQGDGMTALNSKYGY
ncbi:Smad nuclear interacting protein [Fasciola gigantica]|uniref:Smad nuclear interacting protein n=1 Tax=Fasciola gigantica TaxID=46835 RepID=A0A504YBG4_FASGI|nr:Smad nuclear interacting protein [Fasciola gigantica]